MYYVAYLTQPHINIVVPVDWVYQNGKQWQKFVNLGLNSNQTHRIFYTHNQAAWTENGEPFEGYATDFTMTAEQFPDEGCYEGKLVKFFMDYDEAVTYVVNRRIGNPAIYNLNRLRERPIPELNVQNEREVNVSFETDAPTPTADSSIGNVSPPGEIPPIQILTTETNSNAPKQSTPITDSTNEIDTSTLASSPDPLADQFDTITVASTSEFGEQVETIGVHNEHHDNPSWTQSDIKTEVVLIVEPTTATINAIDDLIEEPEFIVHEIEDMEIKVKNNIGFGKPFNATSEGLMKRENDVVSGSMPYNETKTGARLYKLGSYNLELPKKVVSTFQEWNSRDDKQSSSFDKRFVHALLLLCDDFENVTKDSIQQEIDEFIHAFIMVRAKNNIERFESMKRMVQELLKEIEKENDVSGANSSV